MKAEIITIGTELLLGEIDDTNATYIARQLREIGLDLHYRTTVGDNEQRIAEVIDHALNRVDVVICTGGLGPTVDDVTREAVARATGRPLEFKQELLNQIAERFRRFKVQMSDNNRRQAYVPQGAVAIPNPVGTAPVFILETERGVVMVLPGVPREMKHLLEHALLPWLKERMGAPAVIRSLTLRTAGVGESQVDARISDLMTNANPTVGLAAHAGQTDVRITAKAGTPAEADALITQMAAEVHSRLGTWIYGTGTERLEDVVVGLLARAGSSVASVEVGMQGLLGQRLRDAASHQPGLVEIGGAFASVDELGSLVEDASGLSPGELARAAAYAVRRKHQTTHGLAVIMQSRQSAEGTSETSTAIAVAAEGDSRVRTFDWLFDRPDAHIWATTHALAMLRRQLLKQGED